nr:NAD regulator [uncultured Gellertiella sp.]
MAEDGAGIEIGLNAAIVSMSEHQPRILVVEEDGALPALPFGPFEPDRHRTLEMSLRQTVEAQTALHMGYIEQLYTFGDRGRHRRPGDEGPHMVSVGYLALTRIDRDRDLPLEGVRWRDWYSFLPWEDWRDGRPELLDRVILPALERWASGPGSLHTAPDLPSRAARLRRAFGLGDFPFDEEQVLERYELLYEAGLVAEAVADGRVERPGERLIPGTPMRHDHRRITATAIARLRGKIKYRPVIFELMPPEFTLTDLQASVEAISGRHLHKQNFRRLVEGADLVEPSGGTTAATGGRPAALFRFRRQVLEERPKPGLRVPRGKV